MEYHLEYSTLSVVSHEGRDSQESPTKFQHLLFKTSANKKNKEMHRELE